MPKDNDEGNKKVEGLFGQIGLGNADPEKILELQEEYERGMAMADFLRNKKGRSFKQALRGAEETEEQGKYKEKKEEGE